MWRRAWAVLLFLAVGLETAALLRRGTGDTLSEQVWGLLSHRWLRPVFWAAWGWLTWHFFLSR